MCIASILCFFFFNDTATTEIYTLSVHDALPISRRRPGSWPGPRLRLWPPPPDRKSTRLNSSHLVISYAVFCLKKKTHTAVIVLNRLSMDSLTSVYELLDAPVASATPTSVLSYRL